MGTRAVVKVTSGSNHQPFFIEMSSDGYLVGQKVAAALKKVLGHYKPKDPSSVAVFIICELGPKGVYLISDMLDCDFAITVNCYNQTVQFAGHNDPVQNYDSYEVFIASIEQRAPTPTFAD